MIRILFLALIAVLILPLPAPKKAYAQDITTGLVGHWTLDETSGTTASDSTANNNDGTMQGGLDAGNDSVGGKIGTALDFDAVDDYINVGSNASIDNVFTGGGTIAAWIYPRTIGANNAGVLFDKQNGGVDIGWMVRFCAPSDLWGSSCPGSSNSFFFAHDFSGNNGEWRTENDAITLNKWQHIALVYDKDSISSEPKIYINGIPVGIIELVAPTGTAVSDDGPGGWIGGRMWANDAMFDGIIDDVRLYDRALSEADILTLAGIKPGRIRYNTDGRVTEYFDSESWIPAAAPLYVPVAAHFNGGASLSQSSSYSADGKTATGSFWVRRTDPNAQDTIYRFNSTATYSAANLRFLIEFTATNELRIRGRSDVPGDVLDAITTGTISDANWHHVMFSFDLTLSDGDCDPAVQIYIDGVAQTFSGTPVCSNTDIDFDVATDRTRIGSGSDTGATGNVINAELADFWLDFGTRIDLSNTANRAEFYANGPVYLGTDGSRPTGSAPEIFLSGDIETWQTNDGTGPGFTENGTLGYAQVRLDTGTWTMVGNELNIAGNNDPSITVLEGTTIAYIGASVGELRTYNWDGTNWSQVGNSLAISGITDPAVITALDSDTIAYVDGGNDDLRTYNWDGTNWTQTGNDLNIAGASWPSITRLTANTVAFFDWNNTDLRTFAWDGTDWTSVGNPLNLGAQIRYFTALDSNTIVAGGSSVIQTFRFDGTDWAQIGNSAYADAGNMHLTYLSDNRIAVFRHFSINGIRELEVYKWTGTDWVYEGIAATIAGSNWGDIAALDSRTVAFIDGSNDDLRTYTISQCTNPARLEGTVIYNTTSSQMQFCNGTDWIAMGPPGDGGGGCSNPAGTEGAMVFNSNGKRMQYCEGSDWIQVGREPYVAPTNGLIGHWTLDETSGTTANDSTANNNDGTMQGGMTAAADTVPGKDGTALDFDGTDDYIDIGNPATFQLTGSMTIAVWVKQDTSTEIKHFVSKQGNTPDYGWRLATDGADDTFVMGVTSDGVAMVDRASIIVPSLGEWYHVVGVYNADEQTLDIYVNGELNNGTLSGTVPASQYDSSVNVNIGQRSAGNRDFDGNLDDVRIYDRALSAAEVYNIYMATGGN